MQVPQVALMEPAAVVVGQRERDDAAARTLVAKLQARLRCRCPALALEQWEAALVAAHAVALADCPRAVAIARLGQPFSRAPHLASRCPCSAAEPLEAVASCMISVQLGSAAGWVLLVDALRHHSGHRLWGRGPGRQIVNGAETREIDRGGVEDEHACTMKPSES